MDGSPSRGTDISIQDMLVTDPVSLGETIPIRLFLGGFDLTPTFREVNKKYSTRYYLSLVLIDEGPFSPFDLSHRRQQYSMLIVLIVQQMPVATSSNQKSCFTGKRPKLRLHNYTKRSRNLSRLLERQDEERLLPVDPGRELVFGTWRGFESVCTAQVIGPALASCVKSWAKEK